MAISNSMFYGVLLRTGKGRGSEKPLPHDSALRAQGNHAGCRKLLRHTHGWLTVLSVPDVGHVTVRISIAHFHAQGERLALMTTHQ